MTTPAKGANVSLLFVPSEAFATYWPVAEPMLKLVQRRNAKDYGMDDVKRTVLDGQALLWMILVDGQPMAAMTTTEIRQPRRKTLHIEMIGGKGAGAWVPEATRQLADIAKKIGYKAITTNARRGWKNLADMENFRPQSVAYEMEL